MSSLSYSSLSHFLYENLLPLIYQLLSYPLSRMNCTRVRLLVTLATNIFWYFIFVMVVFIISAYLARLLSIDTFTNACLFPIFLSFLILPFKTLNWTPEPFRGDIQLCWRYRIFSREPPGFFANILSFCRTKLPKELCKLHWRKGLLLKLGQVNRYKKLTDLTRIR